MRVQTGLVPNPAVREFARDSFQPWILEELYCSPVFSLPSDSGQLVGFTQSLGAVFLHHGDSVHKVLNPPVFETSSCLGLFQLVQASGSTMHGHYSDAKTFADSELETQRYLILLAAIFALDYLVFNTEARILYLYDHDQAVSVFGSDEATVGAIASRFSEYLNGLKES